MTVSVSDIPGDRKFRVSLERPLHVKVAEALGCRAAKMTCGPASLIGEWFCSPPPRTACAVHPEAFQLIPRYDTDWSATGPLIEKYRIELAAPSQPGGERPWCLWDAALEDTHRDEQSPIVEGETPLIAVCNLILVLKEAGKL